jgi:methyltransferase-like protein/cyclopropane fatty-acyl-phospholipid synthase-like methyltransferase
MSQPEATSYDEIPYDDQVFSYTHPDRLATLATLYGMSPRPVDGCRILELGCGTGYNLIAIGQGLPGSCCVGVDLSARQIEAGRAVIETLGIANVELRCLDLSAVDDRLGTFDYILCHGVYSWVPGELQDKILAICADLLAPQGVAYVSYNTYPGWHLRGLVREMMLFHAGRFAEPRQRVQQARAILSFLTEAADIPDNAYGRLLRDEAGVLKKVSDSYVYHEHLEANNHPVYFHEFAERAAARGLQYLSEAQFARLPGRLSPKAVEILGQVPDIVRLEQYLDFVHNRTFRQTLVCHQAVALQRPVPPDRVRTMHVSGLARPVAAKPDVAPTVAEHFATEDGFSLSTDKALLKATLVTLFEALPHALSFEGLWNGVSARLARRPELLSEGHSALAACVLRAFLNGFLNVHVHPPSLVTDISERPVGSPLARHQATRDQPVTNVWNRYVKLDPPLRFLLRYLDGRRDRDGLTEALADLVLGGELALQQHGQPVRDPEQVRQACRASLDEFLSGLAKNALLVG